MKLIIKNLFRWDNGLFFLCQLNIFTLQFILYKANLYDDESPYRYFLSC